MNSDLDNDLLERNYYYCFYTKIGDSQQSLSFSFRIGKATISKIISETCDAIHTVLKDTYLSSPQSKEE